MTHRQPCGGSIEWVKSGSPVAYEDAVREMEAHVAALAEGRVAERVWLLEHPSLYTAGTSSKACDLIDAHRFPVHKTGRGGQFTYHGPGQRIVYVMLDLNARGRDVRDFVGRLEDWIIATLARLDVVGERRPGRVGVWVSRPRLGEGREDKIAAIGIRVRRWITYHGFSINVGPDLEHYSSIIPCGLAGHGVTSLTDLGITVTMEDVDRALISAFDDVFADNSEHQSQRNAVLQPPAARVPQS